MPTDVAGYHWRDMSTRSVGISRRVSEPEARAKVLRRSRLRRTLGRNRPEICRAARSRAILGTSHAAAASIQDVGIDHRRAHVLVAKEFLHGTDGVVIEQQVRGETVAKDMRRDVLADACLASRLADSFLHHRRVQMKSVPNPRESVDVVRGGGEDPLPASLAVNVGILAGQRREV